MVPTKDIDILEATLRKQGDLLDILLLDHTSRKNIIWGTDSYKKYGKGFEQKDKIKKNLITESYSHLIQPRAAKNIEEQRQRTRDKAEVFTPLKIVDQMNKLVDWPGDIKVTDDKNWQEYVTKLMLEISCGEAPFIVSRYNPTSHTGKLIKLENRVGFLDRKLRVVTQYCNSPKKWLQWAKEAYKASYGYEWQGDNVLIARENLLYTLIDYYKDKFGRRPQLSVLLEFAEIISWNIFQMDGLKYVIPMSCRDETLVTPGNLTLFDQEPERLEKFECVGCQSNNNNIHNGIYVKVMDWESQKPIFFKDLINNTKLLKVTADTSADRTLLKKLKSKRLIDFEYINLENAKENSEHRLKGWENNNVPAFFTLDVSILDGPDVLAPPSASIIEQRLKAILGGGKQNLADRRQLLGHFHSGNEVFVTGDKGDISNKKNELAEVGIIVLHNEELEGYIEHNTKQTP